jgi:hypothetical protein
MAGGGNDGDEAEGGRHRDANLDGRRLTSDPDGAPTALAAGLPFVGIPLQSEQDANVTFAQNQGAARLIAQKAAGRPR